MWNPKTEEMIENWYIVFVAALAPMVLGAFWYSPKLFGNAWIKATGITEEKSKDVHMGKVFTITYLFCCLVALAMISTVIHQIHVYSVFEGQVGFGVEGSELMHRITSFLGDDINNFRTFKHGMLHGAVSGFFIALPIIGTNALFEARGFKYIAINAGYWIVSMMLMGGIVCQWA